MRRTPTTVACSIALFLVTVLTAGCDGRSSTGDPRSQPQQTASAPVSSPAPSPVANPVPPALSGIWHTRFQGSDQKLSLSGGVYKIYVTEADMAVGTAAVKGSKLTLAGSDTCQGIGIYRWTIQGSNLTFKAVNHDPCPRGGILAGHTWTQVSD